MIKKAEEKNGRQGRLTERWEDDINECIRMQRRGNTTGAAEGINNKSNLEAFDSKQRD